jgi:exosortase A
VNAWLSSRTFSHGFLIVPLFLYLVWVRRSRLAVLRPKQNYWGLPVLVILSGVWVVGSLGDIRVVQQFALVGMLDAMIWILLGSAVVRALWFPLAFLFFAVPFGEASVGPLQDFTAYFAVALLKLSRVPLIQENRTIWVPSGPWVIAEACSGIRYLISSIVLGLIYASLVYRSWKRRVLFVLASIVVPILANGIRAYGIILIAYLTDNRLATDVDHIVYGWVFFTMVQLLLFSIGLVWREPPPEESQLLIQREMDSTRVAHSLRGAATASLCVLICVILGRAAEAYVPKFVATRAPLELTLMVDSPWQQAASFSDDSWAPGYHPKSKFSRTYFFGDEQVDIYLADYSGLQGGVELVDFNHQLSNPNLWLEVAGGFRSVVVDGQTARVRWDEIRSNSVSRLVWSWYSIGGTSTSDPVKVKLLQAKAKLLGQPAATAVIAMSTDYLLDPSEAASKLQDFLHHMSIENTPLRSTAQTPATQDHIQR